MNKEGIKDTDFEMVGENVNGNGKNQSKAEKKPWWKDAAPKLGGAFLVGLFGWGSFELGKHQGYKKHDNMCKKSGIYDAANRQREYERRKNI